MKMHHISWLTGALAAVSLATASAQDGGAEVIAVPDPGENAPSLLEVHPTDVVLGDPDAPVTIFEFSSLTCPHCADFHENTLPELKAELIDTGQVNMVVRHFPLDQLALRGAIVAECVPDAQYHQFLDVLYRTQTDWRDGSDPLQAILQAAMLAGVPRDSLESCMADEAVMNGILSVRLRATSELGIQSTPTFFVGDQMVRGAQPYAVFADAVEAAMPEEPEAPADGGAGDDSAGDDSAGDDAGAAPADEAGAAADGGDADGDGEASE